MKKEVRVGYCRYLRGESQHFRWNRDGGVIDVLCAEDFFGVKIVNAGTCVVKSENARGCDG